MTEPVGGRSFQQVVADMAAAGDQLTRLGAAEASAGNMSVYAANLQGLDEALRPSQDLPLPVPVPNLAGGWLVITGTGCRLRDVSSSPQACLCVLEILPGGLQARLFQAEPVFPTSEMDSHLAVHQDQAARDPLIFQAVVHAQPVSLTYLSHLEEYSQGRELARRLVRWQPETILIFPEGIGLVPFKAPGSPEQAAATRIEVQNHPLVVWQKHGVLARAGTAVEAADLVEYAEAAAAYELLNLRLGKPAAGLSDEELRQICAAYGVKQGII